MKPKFFICVLLLAAASAFFPAGGHTQAPETSPKAPGKLTLTQAIMCETVRDGAPQNPAIVFSIAIGKVSCFSVFDPVPDRTYIYHNWYYRDTLSTKIKLFLQPPRWATYSSIQLREADRGPWRVEITDPGGKTIQVLRFTITDG